MAWQKCGVLHATGNGASKHTNDRQYYPTYPGQEKTGYLAYDDKRRTMIEMEERGNKIAAKIPNNESYFTCPEHP